MDESILQNSHSHFVGSRRRRGNVVGKVLPLSPFCGGIKDEKGSRKKPRKYSSRCDEASGQMVGGGREYSNHQV